MYQFLFIFFIYAFLGWCTEVSYAALETGTFVNRGFLNGPVCPIYGFGVVIVVGCLTPLMGNKLLLFFGSVLLTSLLELATGFLLEKLFHQHWWDYSDQPFNIGGYICLRFSILWGLACMFVVYLLHPTVLLVIRTIPPALGLVLLGLSGAVMGVDLAATVSTIAKINRRLSHIDELAAKIHEISNEFGGNLADKVLETAQTGAEWKEEWTERAEGWREEVQDSLEDRRQAIARRREELRQLSGRLSEALEGEGFGQRRLLRAFPRMRSTRHDQAMARLRRRMTEGKSGRADGAKKDCNF